MTSNIPHLFRSAVALEKQWRQHGFQFCFIGGIAVQRWGEPRNTRDLDLTLLTGFGTEARYIDTVLRQYTPRHANAREFALLNRVLLVTDSAGVPIDISLGAMPFEERTIARSSAFAVIGGESITTCSASDLVVHKSFAARPEDWIDVRGILVRSGMELDWDLILDELTPLVELKGEPEILDQLNQLRQELS